MAVPHHLSAFWGAFRQAAGAVDDARFYEAFHFGDGEQLADELAALVLSGAKRATAAALWVYESAGQRLPRPGDLSIVTDGSGEPLCVIETQSVETVAFQDVGAAFAAAEGEGDASLACWREGHRRYFSRECAAAGRLFSEDMPVVCERFKMVYARA